MLGVYLNNLIYISNFKSNYKLIQEIFSIHFITILIFEFNKMSLLKITINLFTFKEVPPTKIDLKATLNGATLEMGQRGQSPLITENIMFEDFQNYSERLMEHFERFLVELDSK